MPGCGRIWVGWQREVPRGWDAGPPSDVRAGWHPLAFLPWVPHQAVVVCADGTSAAQPGPGDGSPCRCLEPALE